MYGFVSQLFSIGSIDVWVRITAVQYRQYQCMFLNDDSSGRAAAMHHKVKLRRQ